MAFHPNTLQGGGVYPVTYANITAVVLPATGAAYAPDGVNLVNNDTVLFTNFIILSGVGGRGVYRATVVAGNVTAWTRVVYGQSPIGDSIDGDIVVVTAGVVYDDHKFQCTDTPLALWVDLGPVTVNYTQPFAFADWAPDAWPHNNYYYLLIVHNLNSLNPVISVMDNTNVIVNVDTVISFNANITKLMVPLAPDMRFAGTITIIKQ